jgi:hypothetical protein
MAFHKYACSGNDESQHFFAGDEELHQRCIVREDVLNILN